MSNSRTFESRPPGPERFGDPRPLTRGQQVLRGGLWLGFFAVILVAWWLLYAMAVQMGLDMMGRPSMSDTRAPEPMMAPMPAPETPETLENGAGAAAAPGAQMDNLLGLDEAPPPPPLVETPEEAGRAGSAPMAMDRPASDGMAMDGMDMGAMDMEAMAMMTAFGPLWAMWAIMMAAMMLPTMVPTMQSYEALIRRGAGNWGGLLAVLAGYLVVWAGFAAAITLAQLGLFRAGIIDMMGLSQYRLVTAALLVVVGLYQFTPQKDACHGVCHSPTLYFLGHWKPGTLGGLRMGTGLGAYCVGCCWGFMALGFVGGVMSLLWMGLATLVMILEKIPAIGQFLLRPVGVLLILAGLVTAFWPQLAPLLQGA